eukprot:TRINITY_DN104_c0_g2_i2.p1 TRINITY_DN104_c0_g2~~TRINITY_DN104_c0_g2_i2.p1  ORF type:complete len:640 (-),score=361.88 TRINITY_DN104_c0_g2_i2:178-1974(-)
MEVQGLKEMLGGAFNTQVIVETLRNNDGDAYSALDELMARAHIMNEENPIPQETRDSLANLVASLRSNKGIRVQISDILEPLANDSIIDRSLFALFYDLQTQQAEDDQLIRELETFGQRVDLPADAFIAAVESFRQRAEESSKRLNDLQNQAIEALRRIPLPALEPVPEPEPVVAAIVVPAIPEPEPVVEEPLVAPVFDEPEPAIVEEPVKAEEPVVAVPEPAIVAPVVSEPEPIVEEPAKVSEPKVEEPKVEEVAPVSEPEPVVAEPVKGVEEVAPVSEPEIPSEPLTEDQKKTIIDGIMCQFRIVYDKDDAFQAERIETIKQTLIGRGIEERLIALHDSSSEADIADRLNRTYYIDINAVRSSMDMPITCLFEKHCYPFSRFQEISSSSELKTIMDAQIAEFKQSSSGWYGRNPFDFVIDSTYSVVSAVASSIAMPFRWILGSKADSVLPKSDLDVDFHIAINNWLIRNEVCTLRVGQSSVQRLNPEGTAVSSTASFNQITHVLDYGHDTVAFCYAPSSNRSPDFFRIAPADRDNLKKLLAKRALLFNHRIVFADSSLFADVLFPSSSPKPVAADAPAPAPVPVASESSSSSSPAQ